MRGEIIEGEPLVYPSPGSRKHTLATCALEPTCPHLASADVVVDLEVGSSWSNRKYDRGDIFLDPDQAGWKKDFRLKKITTGFRWFRIGCEKFFRRIIDPVPWLWIFSSSEVGIGFHRAARLVARKLGAAEALKELATLETMRGVES